MSGQIEWRANGQAPVQIAVQAIGIITLAPFTDTSILISIGDNLFRSIRSPDSAVVEQPGANCAGHLLSFLEMSNVDLGQQEADLISAERSSSLMTLALSTADEMLRSANQMSN